MSTNDQSILTTVKKTLGLLEDYSAFDQDLILFINSVFGDLRQLGVGPPTGFEIEDSSKKWVDFIGNDLRFAGVKTFMHLKVKQVFDPPENGAVSIAMEKMVQEAAWRLKVTVDEVFAEVSAVTDEGAIVWILDEQGNFPEEAPYNSVGFNPVNRMIWRKVRPDA